MYPSDCRVTARNRAEPDTKVLSAVAAVCPICLLLNRPVELIEAIDSEQLQNAVAIVRRGERLPAVDRINQDLGCLRSTVGRSHIEAI
jgi:hypothetical protein